MRGLQTRGVNVRPKKRQTFGCSPAPLRISSAYDPTGSPGRPWIGYRDVDYGLRTGRKRSRGPRHVKVTPAVPLEQRIAEAEARMTAAQDDARACKAQGLPHTGFAQKARAARAEVMRLKGEVVVQSEIEQVHATGAVGSAMGSQD